MPRSHRSKGRKILFLFFLTALLAFGCGELLLRWQHARFQKGHKDIEQLYRPASAPGLVYEHLPNVGGANGIGYRGPDRDKEKPRNVFRVAVVGDDIARGEDLPWEDTFAARLQDMLDKDNPGKVQVMLFAEQGYSMDQEAALLENKALAYSPDLVVWAYRLTDPGDPSQQGSAVARYFDESQSFMLSWLQRQLFEARRKIRRFSEHEPSDRPPNLRRDLHTLGADHVRRVFSRVKELCKAADVPVVLLVIPNLDKETLTNDPGYMLTVPGYPLMDVHTAVTRLGLEQGFSVVDGMVGFKNKSLAELSMECSARDRLMPNARGHELLALLLHERLIR